MRALLSVYDKEGLVELAQGLSDLGWELVASGNTSAKLSEAGIAHLEVADVTGSPEMLGGRVKTLHPKIHGGILADRSKPEHSDDLSTNGIEAIDLVVSNLYPFSSDPSIELIDIGGPAMVRAAAKNHEHVGIVTSPADYPIVLEELRASGALSSATRRRLARAAFAHTAAYDAAIVAWLDAGGPTPIGDLVGATTADVEESALSAVLPQTLHLTLERTEVLRYGENPHQRGSRYRIAGTASWWDDMEQHGGNPLSYLNLFDGDAAWRLVHELAADAGAGQAAVAIIKHANPCGAAVAGNLVTAYERALECDVQSAFGGVVAIGGDVTIDVADAIAAGPQADVIIAASYAPEALEKLRAGARPPVCCQARRLSRQYASCAASGQACSCRTSTPSSRPARSGGPSPSARRPRTSGATSSWPGVCAAARPPTPSPLSRPARRWASARVSSPGSSRRRSPSRRLGSAPRGAPGASDAFFPFPDGLLVLADAGVTAIVQPGGSVKDEEVIAAADGAGLAMVMTGERHFRH